MQGGRGFEVDVIEDDEDGEFERGGRCIRWSGTLITRGML